MLLLCANIYYRRASGMHANDSHGSCAAIDQTHNVAWNHITTIHYIELRRPSNLKSWQKMTKRISCRFDQSQSGLNICQEKVLWNIHSSIFNPIHSETIAKQIRCNLTKTIMDWRLARHVLWNLQPSIFNPNHNEQMLTITGQCSLCHKAGSSFRESNTICTCCNRLVSISQIQTQYVPFAIDALFSNFKYNLDMLP